MNVNVLQFGDFYSAILAFWVTLVSLAHTPDACRTFFHLFGGILIAFAVELDRTSLWAFAAPASIGAIILIFSWVGINSVISLYEISSINFDQLNDYRFVAVVISRAILRVDFGFSVFCPELH
jgi:hypothetical protein